MSEVVNALQTVLLDGMLKVILQPWVLCILAALLVLRIICAAAEGYFSNPDYLGTKGEKLTIKKLERLNLHGCSGVVLHNLYVPKDDGSTSEIDVLYITPKGIFVIESKNYSGWVFGSDRQKYWTISLNKHTKEKLYNPIWQNSGHIKWLKQYLVEQGYKNIPFYSLIVFSERCELKKITCNQANTWVIKRDVLEEQIEVIYKTNQECLENEGVVSLSKALESLALVSKVVKTQHIKFVKCHKMSN